MFILITLNLAALVPEACEGLLQVNNQYCQNLENTELVGKCIQEHMEEIGLLDCKKQFTLIVNKDKILGHTVAIKDNHVMDEVVQKVISSPVQGAVEIEGKLKSLETQCLRKIGWYSSLHKRSIFGDKIKDILRFLQQAYMVIALGLMWVTSVTLAVAIALPFIVLGVQKFYLTLFCSWIYIAEFAAKWTGLTWLAKHRIHSK